jgi:hypothetical protein
MQHKKEIVVTITLPALLLLLLRFRNVPSQRPNVKCHVTRCCHSPRKISASHQILAKISEKVTKAAKETRWAQSK